MLDEEQKLKKNMLCKWPINDQHFWYEENIWRWS